MKTRLEKEIERAEERLATLEPGSKEHTELSGAIQKLHDAKSKADSEKEYNIRKLGEWLKAGSIVLAAGVTGGLALLTEYVRCNARMEQVKELKVIKEDQGIYDRDVLNYRG